MKQDLSFPVRKMAAAFVLLLRAWAPFVEKLTESTSKERRCVGQMTECEESSQSVRDRVLRKWMDGFGGDVESFIRGRVNE